MTMKPDKKLLNAAWMPWKAKLFIGFISALGAAALIDAFIHGELLDPPRFAFYLLLGLFSSSLKVSLPGIPGTLSVQLNDAQQNNKEVHRERSWNSRQADL